MFKTQKKRKEERFKKSVGLSSPTQVHHATGGRTAAAAAWKRAAAAAAAAGTDGENGRRSVLENTGERKEVLTKILKSFIFTVMPEYSHLYSSETTEEKSLFLGAR